METMTSRWRMATAASAVALLAGLAVGTAPWAVGQGQDEYPACEDMGFETREEPEDKDETVVCRDGDTLAEWAWVEVDDEEEGESAWQRVRDVVITTTTETQDPQTSTTTETATQTEEVTGVTTRTEFVPGETTVRRTTVVPRTSEPVAPQTRRQDAPPADDVEESTATTTTTMVLPEETSSSPSSRPSSPAATETSTPPNLSASDLVGANVPEESSSGPNWLMVLLVLGAIGSLGGGLWYLLRDEPDDLYK